jgi:hypothetical protein
MLLYIKSAPESIGQNQSDTTLTILDHEIDLKFIASSALGFVLIGAAPMFLH